MRAAIKIGLLRVGEKLDETERAIDGAGPAATAVSSKEKSTKVPTVDAFRIRNGSRQDEIQKQKTERYHPRRQVPALRRRDSSHGLVAKKSVPDISVAVK